jgi:hypothetical protein
MISRSYRAGMLLAVVACLSLGVATVAGAVEQPLRGDGNAAAVATAIAIYTQPPSPAGTLYQSSRNGSDYDRYVWDGFSLPSSQAVTEVRWRGGYDPARFGSGGPVLDFTVSIYPSIPGGSQPDVINPPLIRYQTGGNAGETLAGPAGNAIMYDYDFVLPATFQVTANTKYWLQIVADQNGIPDWGFSAATGGDGQHFLQYAAAGDVYYATVSGDAAFTLLGPGHAIYLPLVQR